MDLVKTEWTLQICKSTHFTEVHWHIGTSIHWYITQNFQHIFSILILFRRSFKITIFSRFLEVPIATTNFMKKSIMTVLRQVHIRALLYF